MPRYDVGITAVHTQAEQSSAVGHVHVQLDASPAGLKVETVQLQESIEPDIAGQVSPCRRISAQQWRAFPRFLCRPI